MKNAFVSIKDKIIQSYVTEHENSDDNKSTNINILLNRVKQDQKNESRKKILFSAVTSIGLVLFGVLIF